MIPSRVRAARQRAAAAGFVYSSTDDVGRLLRTLSAAASGTIGELGTGFGIGTAWLAEGLPRSGSLVSVELDAARAAAARELFADDIHVTVLAGDWSAITSHAPFALLFADGGDLKRTDPRAVIGLVRPGGIIVMDDFTAPEDWDEERRRTRDPLREFWFAHPAVAACEAGVGDDKFGRGTRARALIATRLV